MKKLFILFTLILFTSVSGFSQFKFGAGANLFFDGGYLGLGAKAHYQITDDFAGQASFHYMLDDIANYTIDLDVLYSGFNIGDLEGFNITPFAGINIFNFDVGLFGIGGSSTGINLGVLGNIPITESLDLYIEPKLILSGAGTLVIGGGIYF